MKPISKFIMSLCAFILAYYVCILLHEWAHGTAAWLLGVKHNPFDIIYGGWTLSGVDEGVDYGALVVAKEGFKEGIIAISGVAMSVFLFLVGVGLSSTTFIKERPLLLIFIYWTLAINLVPIVQYFTLTTFSNTGDVGHFVHGFSISSWFIFIPGTLFVTLALVWFLVIETPKVYAGLPIRSLWGRRLLLLAALSTIFLLIYTHGYNPFTDPGTNDWSKILAGASILLVPVLWMLCDPSRQWVKAQVQYQQAHLD